MRIPNPDVVEVSAGDEVCAYCHKGVSPTGLGRYGPLYKLEDLTVHYFCMLFSPVLPNGEDHEGIFGYLHDDIQGDIDEGLEKVCKYCYETGATIQCSKEFEGRGLGRQEGGVACAGSKQRKVVEIQRCSTTFHYSCARDEGVRFQFFGAFSAVCMLHAISQRRVNCGERWECPICFSPAGIDFLIKCSCCISKENIFHMCCLQESAWNLGFKYFRCPQCRNGPSFKQQMKRSGGIYIPECDADHFAEEDDEVAETEEVLPLPIVCCRVVEDEDWEFYSNMRNAPYSSNRIHLSLRTPWPKTISKAYADGSFNWKNVSDGGACSVAASPGSYYYSGFFRLRPNEQKSRKRASAGFDLVLLVFRGIVVIKYHNVRRAGISTCYRRRRRLAKKLLLTQTVARIQPGIEYSLENISGTETILFYMLRKLGGSEEREYRGQGMHPRITYPGQLNWKPPSEPGSASELVGIERCWTWTTSNQGFYKIRPLTCTGFAINKLGHMMNFVCSGQVRVRSSKFTGDLSSSSEDDEDDDDDDERNHSVRDRSFVSEVYVAGTSFEIPYKCCYVVENWNDGRDLDPASAAVVFYDYYLMEHSSCDDSHRDSDREFPSSSRVPATGPGMDD